MKHLPYIAILMVALVALPAVGQCWNYLTVGGRIVESHRETTPSGRRDYTYKGVYYGYVTWSGGTGAQYRTRPARYRSYHPISQRPAYNKTYTRPYNKQYADFRYGYFSPAAISAQASTSPPSYYPSAGVKHLGADKAQARVGNVLLQKLSGIQF